MAVVGGVRRASFGRQVARGIGFFVGGAFALLAVAMLVSWLSSDDDGRPVLGLRLGATVAVLALAAGVSLVQRSLRRWSGRPRWLVPAAVVVLVAALVPAVYAPAPSTSDADGCTPLLNAWEPVVAEPSAADLAFYEGVFTTPLPKGKAQLAAFLSAQEAKHRMPAFERVSSYALWLDSDAACAPSSRTHLAWSAAGLGVGAAALTLAVRRRRSA
jgi:hypothetical protein